MKLRLVKIVTNKKNLEILQVIKEEGKASWSTLSKKVKISPSTIDGKLKQLQKLGLIEPRPEINEETGRPMKPYYLTPYGKAVLEKLEELEALLQTIAETPKEKEKKELVKKALSGRLNYDKTISAGGDEEV